MRSTEKKNILLINGFGTPISIINELLSNSGTDSNIYLAYPLGIMTLAGWIRQEFPDFKIQIIDATMVLHQHISKSDREPIDFDDFIDQIISQSTFTPDFIGISISFSNGHKACLQLSRKCKEKWTTSKIIAGGVHASTFTHRIITDPSIDYVIKGPGDLAFIDLLQSLSEGQVPDNIPGVVSGINNVNSMALTLKDLNSIPDYPYDLLDMEYLVKNESTNPIIEKDMRTGMIFMSRGCPFGCSFCSADKVHGKKMFFIDAHKMVDQVEYLINTFNVNTISIIDDLFGADKNYFFEFFKKIDERGLKFNLVIPGGLSIAVFNEEMIDVLIEHGLKAVYFPVESGSKFVQENIIKKRVDLNKAIRLINYTKKKELFTGINIVIGSPGETKELIFETYEFIKKLPVDSIAFFIAYPYPKTEMTEILLNRGTFTENELIEIWDVSTQGFKLRPFDTEEISGQELSDLVYDFNIKLNFFFNYNIRNKNYSGILVKFNKVINRYPFHVVALACRAKCYYELGEKDNALKDVMKINELINENTESLKLFERYSELIQETISFDKIQLEEKEYSNE